MRASGGTGVFAGGKIKPRTGSEARAGSPRAAATIPPEAIFTNVRRELSANSISVMQTAKTPLMPQNPPLK